MSYSHVALARALHIRGFVFSCEPPVFPQDRSDKSYITPDIIVFYDGRSLVVEVDGPMHSNVEQAIKDHNRDKMWLSNGFETIRFPASLALERPHFCVSQIIDHFSKL